MIMVDLPSFAHLPPLPPKPVDTKKNGVRPTVSTNTLPLTSPLSQAVSPTETTTAPPKKVSAPIAGPLPVLPGAAAFREPVKELDLEGDIEFLEETPLPKTSSGAPTKIGAYATSTTLNPYNNTTHHPLKYNKSTIILILAGGIVILGTIVFVILNIITLNSSPELEPIPVITVNPDEM